MLLCRQAAPNGSRRQCSAANCFQLAWSFLGVPFTLVPRLDQDARQTPHFQHYDPPCICRFFSLNIHSGKTELARIRKCGL
jgi:hypothetical protein